mgnify:CR=1 FL=1
MYVHSIFSRNNCECREVRIKFKLHFHHLELLVLEISLIRIFTNPDLVGKTDRSFKMNTYLYLKGFRKVAVMDQYYCKMK